MSNDTKKCTRCQEVKLIEQFRFRNKSKGTLQPWCKPCFSSYEREKWKSSKERRDKNIKRNKERRLRNKEYIWNYLKSNPCEACGTSDPRVLEFDHLDRNAKSFSISDICIRSYSIKRIEEEIKKCRVLCANCHRIHTYEQCNYWVGN